MANEITTIIKTKLNEHMETFMFSAESMHDTAEQVTKIMKDISGKMGKLRDDFQEMAEQIAQATWESADQLAQAAQDLTERAATMENAHVTTTMPQNEYQSSTYASIVQQQIPLAHAVVVTRGDITDKQILIQKDKNMTDNLLENLTEKDLVTKVNTALDFMGIEAAD